MKFIKQHWPLLVGLGLPLLLIIITFAAFYLPSLSAKPTQDFLFTMRDYSRPSVSYQVNGGTVGEYDDSPIYRQDLQYAPVPKPRLSGSGLYRYDVISDKSIKLDLSDAQKFSLDSSLESRDGFTIDYGRGNGGIIFSMFGGSYDYNNRFISKGAYQKKLNLPADSYSGQFEFLGWIK